MIRIAIKQAAKSKYIYKLGCVITKGKRVIGTGFNSISYCSVNNFKNSRHAEMDAILNVLNKPNGLSSLAGATIYVSRIVKDGIAMAKPCNKCMALIKSVGISKIVYTNSVGKTTVEYS